MWWGGSPLKWQLSVAACSSFVRKMCYVWSNRVSCTSRQKASFMEEWGRRPSQNGKHFQIWNKTKGWIRTEKKIDSSWLTWLLIDCPLLHKYIAQLKMIIERTVHIRLHSANWIFIHILVLVFKVLCRPLHFQQEEYFQQWENWPMGGFWVTDWLSLWDGPMFVANSDHQRVKQIV